MKVLTLDNITLAAACKKLAQIVTQSGYHPDVIVGIPKGGIRVAELVADALPDKPDMCLVEANRPSSAKKKSSPATAKFLKSLPYWALNMLRRVEAHLLKNAKPQLPYPTSPTISEECSAKISRPGCKVLVVDDAVDSGATMHSVVEFLKTEFPNATIRTCAITVTTDAPIMRPDYAVYNNHILIRFPWSIDYKENRNN